MGVCGGFVEQRGVFGDGVGVIAEDPHGGGADAEILGFEKLAEQRPIDLVEAPGGPERFELVVLEPRVFGVELGDPALERGQDFRGRVGAEFPAAAVARAVFGQLEVF